MAKTQIPMFKEKNGKFYNFLKALKDCEYYHSVIGCGEAQWKKWRAKEMRKYNLGEEDLDRLVD